MKLPKLYKQKSKKIMQWWIETDLKIKPPQYIVSHGYVDGAIQTTSTDIKEGKNIGRANATTAIEQCELEAQALWQKQKDRKGYSENINAIKPIMPMLAHKWQDYKDRITFPAMVQPKYDGQRCLAHIKNNTVSLISRQNKPIPGLDHIVQAIQHLPDMILDGELYNKDIGFRNVISGIKKAGGNAFTHKIQYHVYDIAVEKRYDERLSTLEQLNLQHPIVPVPTHTVKSIKEIDDWYKHYKDLGYEGVMIRNPSGIYTFDKRSKDLLKYKKFLDKEYTIIGAKENKGKLAGTCTFVCRTITGKEFECMPEGTQEERSEYWNNWLEGNIQPGELLTVEYFEFTDEVNEIPRFPIGKAIRNE